MSRRGMILLLLVIFGVYILTSHAYARTVCKERTVYTGCTKASDFGCNGEIKDVRCDSSGFCTATCIESGATYCTDSECAIFDTPFRGGCGEFNVMNVYSGKLSESEVSDKCKDMCPYGWSNDCSYYQSCTNKFLGFICVEWQTTVFSTCEAPACTTPSQEISVSCQKDAETIKDCWEEEEGSCTREGTFCYQGSVAQCDSNGRIQVINKCEDFGLVCKQKTNTYAVCVNPTEREDAKECAIEGEKRCDPVDTNKVQICKNGVWQDYEECSYGCNATGVNSGNECNNFNLESGSCTAGQSVCIDVGSDAFLFVCVQGDWTLVKECPTDRCDPSGTSCWEGCEFLETRCFPENNTCYYCNENGEWVFSGKCLGHINNVTMQCVLDDVCDSGAKTCSGRWVLQCVNGEWRRIEECSYGCKLGECVGEGGDVFQPMMTMADLFVIIFPALSIFLATLVSVAFIREIFLSLVRRMKKWVSGKA